jgi:hypothetical protein
MLSCICTAWYPRPRIAVPYIDLFIQVLCHCDNPTHTAERRHAPMEVNDKVSSRHGIASPTSSCVGMGIGTCVTIKHFAHASAEDMVLTIAIVELQLVMPSQSKTLVCTLRDVPSGRGSVHVLVEISVQVSTLGRFPGGHIFLRLTNFPVIIFWRIPLTRCLRIMPSQVSLPSRRVVFDG